MTDSTRNVIKALGDAMIQQQIEAEARILQEKQHAIIRSEEAIYSEISRWTGIQVSRGDRIPMVRDGRKVGEIPESLLTKSPVSRVSNASLIEYSTEIKRKISAFRAILRSSEEFFKALGDLTYLDRATLQNEEVWPGGATAKMDSSLESRIIREVGTLASAELSMLSLFHAAQKQIENLEAELENRKTNRGRPRNEAAYAVARELALLYAKVTGKRPTYAESQDGLSGEFTPALREVFDALGWKETSLKNYAQDAVESVTETDMRYEEKGFEGLFSSVWGE